MTPVPGSAVRTRWRRRSPGVGAVGDDDHAGVNRVPDADAAAVVQRHPAGAAGGVEHRVEQRPVGDRVGAVLHRLGLAVGRSDRAGIEMVPADDERRLAPCPSCTSQLNRWPISARSPYSSQQIRAGSPWKWIFSRACRIQRASDSLSGNVSSTAWSVTAMSAGSPERAAQRNGPAPATEERADVLGDESRESGTHRACPGGRRPGPGGCCRSRKSPRRGACRSSIAWTCTCMLSRTRASYPVGSAARSVGGCLERVPGGDVADAQVVGRGLIGQHIRHHAAADQLGQHLGDVADQSDRECDVSAPGGFDQLKLPRRDRC